MNDELLLEYFKLAKTSEGAITLDKTGEVGVSPVVGGGATSSNKEKEHLSEIIEKFNKRFGTEFSEQDKVLAQIKSYFMKNELIVQSAKSGDKTAFKTLCEKYFNEIVTSIYEENNEFFKNLFENEDKLKFIKDMLLADIYNDARNNT